MKSLTKSLNKSEELWTKMTAKEIEKAQYIASCCLNVRVNSSVHNDTPSQESCTSK
jgi:hypothetical protein